MSHDYHPQSAPVLHDGCAECAVRGSNAFNAIVNLDPANFARAWNRAAAWQLDGLPDLQDAEVLLLEALKGVQLQMEKLGWPIGMLPDRGPLHEGWH